MGDPPADALRLGRVRVDEGLFDLGRSDAPSLDDHLGDARWYLDIMFGHTPKGMTVLGLPHRWSPTNNWKLGPMNFAADGPHAVILPQVTFGIAVRMAVMSIVAGN